MTRAKKKAIGWVMAGVGLLAVVLTPILIWVVDWGGQARQEWRLSENGVRLAFLGFSQTYALPEIIPPTPGMQFTYDWEIASMINENGQEGYFAELVDDSANEFTLIPIMHYENATIRFRANIKAGKETEQLYYTVEMFDQKEEEFRTLFSPNQSGSPMYREQGIARRRVFGLYDIDPGRSVLTEGDRENLYKLSGDVMNIGWRYRGEPKLAFAIEGGDESKIETTKIEDDLYILEDDVIRITPQKTTVAGITRLDTLIVEFKSEGTRTVTVTGINSVEVDGKPSARYSYEYNIVNAINTYTMSDVKAIEFNARVNYIINGVEGPNGTPHIDQTEWKDAGLSAFLKPNQEHLATQNLNSARFETQMHHVHNANSYFFREFHRWIPSYSYKAIVIRNNMKTWAEGTWFFGSVYGNGFTLDATPYADNSARVYRNVHGTGWVNNGRENMPIRRGTGWGEFYAFTMASNNSVIDNIHLIGDNVPPQGSVAPKLNAYARINVLGNTAMSGYAFNFMMGSNNALPHITNGSHHNGELREGRYPADITVQNSIIEKGLILVGAQYMANTNRPMVIQNSVLRYAAFTAVWGRGHTGEGRQNAMNMSSNAGLLIRQNNKLGEVEGVKEEYNQVGKAPNVVNIGRIGQNKRFGNSIIIRDLVIYEIATSPFMVDGNFAGTHIKFEGESQLYTWLRLDDVVFPSFKVPDNAFHSNTAVPSISTIVNTLVAKTLDIHPYAAYLDGVTTWLNLLVVDVGADYSNGFSGIDMSKYTPMINVGVPGVGVGMEINVIFTLPPEDEKGITVALQRQTFQGQGMAQIIRSIIPA